MLTVEVYRQMAQVTTPEDAAQIRLPKMLARPLGLRTGPALSLRLLAFLLAPFNSRRFLTIKDRYRLDESLSPPGYCSGKLGPTESHAGKRLAQLGKSAFH